MSSSPLPRITYDGPLRFPAKKPQPPSELDCFFWLENRGLLHDDEYFSPTRAEHSHYSLRRSHAVAGKPQPPTGPLA